MKINQAQQTAFGTKPYIGDYGGNLGLRKYKINLTDGLIKAFTTLTQNGVDDALYFNIGHRIGAKKLTTDTISISLYEKTPAGKGILKSSINLSPITLQKKTKDQIAKLLLETYGKLTQSTKKSNLRITYPTQPKGNFSKSLDEKAKYLTRTYGFDDWTCA